MKRGAAFTSRARVAPLLCVAIAACGGSAMTPDPDPVEPERPVPCTVGNAMCAERVEIVSGRYLPVYGTHLLSAAHAGVTRGLIVIHGNSRNADAYFETGVLAAAEAGVSAGTAGVGHSSRSMWCRRWGPGRSSGTEVAGGRGPGGRGRRAGDQPARLIRTSWEPSPP